jgi:GNAT superfamily N-acetyltransferase
MSIRVRRLEAADKAAWLGLFKAYVDFYKAAVPAEVIEMTWQRLLSDEEDSMLGLVAVDEGNQIVGLATLLFHRSTWSPTCYCYLEDLFVDSRVRGKSIGRTLIEAVYAEADARGATRTYWATEETNYRARGLYDQVATKTHFLQYRR